MPLYLSRVFDKQKHQHPSKTHNFQPWGYDGKSFNKQPNLQQTKPPFSIQVVSPSFFLVGGFNPFEKNSHNGNLSPSRGEHKKQLKPPIRLDDIRCFFNKDHLKMFFSLLQINIFHCYRVITPVKTNISPQNPMVSQMYSLLKK